MTDIQVYDEVQNYQRQAIIQNTVYVLLSNAQFVHNVT